MQNMQYAKNKILIQKLQKSPRTPPYLPIKKSWLRHWVYSPIKLKGNNIRQYAKWHIFEYWSFCAAVYATVPIFKICDALQYHLI